MLEFNVLTPSTTVVPAISTGTCWHVFTATTAGVHCKFCGCPGAMQPMSRPGYFRLVDADYREIQQQNKRLLHANPTR